MKFVNLGIDGVPGLDGPTGDQGLRGIPGQPGLLNKLYNLNLLTCQILILNIVQKNYKKINNIFGFI